MNPEAYLYPYLYEIMRFFLLVNLLTPSFIYPVLPECGELLF